jgi:4'-phosphopantetheinyl transferase EntD
MKGLPDSNPDAITAEHVANPNHWVHSAYHPEEVAYGMKMKPASSSSFWMGRLAMRLALGLPDYAILKDSYGRPKLGSGICGSISHKQDNGVALVSATSNTALSGVGVDLEMTSRPGKRSIAPRVLTDNERESLGRIPGISLEEEVLLQFRYVMFSLIQ